MGNNLCWLKNYELQTGQPLGKTVLILETNPSSTTNSSNYNNLHKNYSKRSGSHLFGCPPNFKEKGISYWYLHISKFVCLCVCVCVCARACLCVWVTLLSHGDYFFLGKTWQCAKWWIHVWKYNMYTSVFWIKFIILFWHKGWIWNIDYRTNYSYKLQTIFILASKVACGLLPMMGMAANTISVICATSRWPEIHVDCWHSSTSEYLYPFC